jgi:hypothetical protein
METGHHTHRFNALAATVGHQPADDRAVLLLNDHNHPSRRKARSFCAPAASISALFPLFAAFNSRSAAIKSQQIYERAPEQPACLQSRAILLDSCDNHLVVQTLQYFFTLQEEAIGRTNGLNQRTFITRTRDTCRQNHVSLVHVFDHLFVDLIVADASWSFHSFGPLSSYKSPVPVVEVYLVFVRSAKS